MILTPASEWIISAPGYVRPQPGKACGFFCLEADMPKKGTKKGGRGY